ncbi:unnamed protein product [Adineta steineri]|uniref:Uncharacterized protein n=1 Tax=Adineta steineri TaxID=433720 RepID=A0A820FT56_9BILA|nr:unnamed protein product [Adineta steineri]
MTSNSLISNITQHECICQMITSNKLVSALNYFQINQTCQLYSSNLSLISIEFYLNSTFIFINQSSISITNKCSITKCRSKIADSISRNDTYNTTNSFNECMYCMEAQYPNFPEDWSNRWYTQDILILTGAGHDCTGNPYYGNLTQCQMFCLRDPTCVGFSREKNLTDSNILAECFLKNNIQLDQTYNSTVWETIVFNSTS